MKIVLTGGGTGGHFYPLIAVAESLWVRASEDSITNMNIYYMSDKPYNELALRSQRIVFYEIPSGKMGLSYSVFQKIISLLKVARGLVAALWRLFILYPDVVLAKGGYSSVPTAIAAKILGIPLFVHESDVIPGRANVFLAKFASKIFVSYDAARQYFDAQKVHYIGQPIRKSLLYPAGDGIEALFDLESDIPILWVVGGSLGAQAINNAVIGVLSELLYHVQVVHQTGPGNIKEVENLADVEIADHPYKKRYHPVAYLDELAIRRLAGVSKLVITRAGSMLFEIAAWKIPSIVIPRPVSNADHNRKNAYAYAAYGGAIVIEEANLSKEVFYSEIMRIINDQQIHSDMSEKAYAFATPHAADEMAKYIIDECYQHEPPPDKPEMPISVLIEEQLEHTTTKK